MIGCHPSKAYARCLRGRDIWRTDGKIASRRNGVLRQGSVFCFPIQIYIASVTAMYCKIESLTNRDPTEYLVTVGKFRSVGVDDYARKVLLCSKRSSRYKVGQQFHEFVPSVQCIQQEFSRKVLDFYTGFNAAACTLTRTFPLSSCVGTGNSLSSLSALLGGPWATTRHAFCVCGICVGSDMVREKISVLRPRLPSVPRHRDIAEQGFGNGNK